MPTPTSNRKHCAEPGCRTLVHEHTRYCPTHKRHYNYASKHWKNIRTQRLNLDSHRCTIRLPGCTTTATTVHLDPQLKGDHTYAGLGNTRSACRHCHGVIDAHRANTTR